MGWASYYEDTLKNLVVELDSMKLNQYSSQSQLSRAEKLAKELTSLLEVATDPAVDLVLQNRDLKDQLNAIENELRYTVRSLSEAEFGLKSCRQKNEAITKENCGLKSQIASLHGRLRGQMATSGDKHTKYFLTLELEKDCTLEEAKDARRVLTKVWHPDRFAGDPQMQRKATQKLALVNEAFEVIQALLKPPSDARRTEPQQPPHAYKKQQPKQSNTTSFITDLKEGEDVEIVEIHPQDDYYAQRLRFIGRIITVRSPIHNGHGWYCTHAVFLSNYGSVLFAHVRVKRLYRQYR